MGFGLILLLILYIIWDVNYFIRCVFTVAMGRLFQSKRKISDTTTIYGMLLIFYTVFFILLLSSWFFVYLRLLTINFVFFCFFFFFCFFAAVAERWGNNKNRFMHNTGC